MEFTLCISPQLMSGIIAADAIKIPSIPTSQSFMRAQPFEFWNFQVASTDQ